MIILCRVELNLNESLRCSASGDVETAHMDKSDAGKLAGDNGV